LYEEAPGILTWAVIGAWLWRQHRLSAPDEITNAVAEWRRDNDDLGGFFTACCEFGPGRWCLSSDLETEFDAWRASEFSAATVPQLRKRLQAKGCKPETRTINSKTCRCWSAVLVRKFNP
jgi:phage/plasmid-associated DNA primase